MRHYHSTRAVAVQALEWEGILWRVIAAYPLIRMCSSRPTVNHQNRHRVSRACANKPLVAAVDGKDEKACAALGIP
jgi:hypothetical protein